MSADIEKVRRMILDLIDWRRKILTRKYTVVSVRFSSYLFYCFIAVILHIDICDSILWPPHRYIKVCL